MCLKWLLVRKLLFMFPEILTVETAFSKGEILSTEM
jgi:hypothetical protein